MTPAVPHAAESFWAGAGRARSYCSGDPDDLAGDAHLWSEFGEDDLGILYRCDFCGVTDLG
ncbi:hypothetical protein SAMN05421874_109177 [Nonomuraea maritima]|uniref:Uncharacterized protein n=1 Tax=Nonomuraea maritima TaxID=683260 RepID=A0A1G9DK93_9ACTN|nr:hypothetical protein [Nonomuraea maritima]SDK64311.1 hypothetical protein SAMN05421874_109177 [Nonomuraea maritima]